MDVAVRTPRPEKVAVVDEVRSRFEESSAAILTEYRGLTVTDLETLRRSLREAGGDYKVYKNTLVRRAVGESEIEGLTDLLEGPTAIAFVRDDVAAIAKVLRDFARTNPNLVVKGGLVGSSLIDARAATQLADLPSREVLHSQLAGMLAAPMQRFASLLQAVPQKLAYALSALVAERERAGETLPGPVESIAPEATASLEESTEPVRDDASEALAAESAVTGVSTAAQSVDAATSEAEAPEVAPDTATES